MKLRAVASSLPLALAILSLPPSAGTASAAEIVALCIGNENYRRPEDRLDTAVADAHLMKEALATYSGGADIEILEDATRAEMLAALARLEERASREGTKLALVFFSGHGVEGRPAGFEREDTFLVPADAEIPTEDALPSAALSLQDILDSLQRFPVAARAVILDCCRVAFSDTAFTDRTDGIREGGDPDGEQPSESAPFGTALLKDLAPSDSEEQIDERAKVALGGLAVPDGTLLAFAASPGRAAAFLRETDETSHFTRFLADQMMSGGGNLRDLVETAAVLTENATEQHQIPYVSYSGAAGPMREIEFRPAKPEYPNGSHFTLDQLLSESPFADWRDHEKRDVLRQVQRKLQGAGHYRGGIDGIQGPGTQGALVEWQRSKRLPVTGMLDAETRRSMGPGLGRKNNRTPSDPGPSAGREPRG